MSRRHGGYAAAAACDHVQRAQYVQSTRAQSWGTMREKDECGPNIGLVRLLIYLCQADFNTGQLWFIPTVSPSPVQMQRRCQYIRTFEPKTIIFMRMHHPEPTTFIMFHEAEHEKRRKLFIGKTQIALLLPRRVEGFWQFWPAPAFHLLLDLLH